MTIRKLAVLLLSLPGLISCWPEHRVSPGCLLPQTVRGLNNEWLDFSALDSGKGAVFFFLSPDCPLCQSYTPLVRELQRTYGNKRDFTFYGVFPGKLYTHTEITDFLKAYDLQTSLNAILDTGCRFTRCLGATTTPEVFVTNPAGAVLYSGRIDDQVRELGQKAGIAAHHDLEDALREIRAGKTPGTQKTTAIGCLIELK